MRFHDPALPVVREEPHYFRELKRALYESERRRAQSPTFTLGDGTTDRAVYDYLKFAGVDVTTLGGNGIVVTTASKGSWTPIDSSGASLSLTAAGSYVRFPIGLVVAQCTVIYPTTASGANAIIGGLPYTIGASNAVAACYCTDATATHALGSANTTLIPLIAAGGAAARTNAQLSTDTIAFTLIYET